VTFPHRLWQLSKSQAARSWRLEKRSRHQAPTALRILPVASLEDDLVGVVTEPLAGRERATLLTVERGHRRHAHVPSARLSRVSDTTPCRGG
jgi:hypothetical protein